MINLLSKIIVKTKITEIKNLQSEMINIDTKGYISCFVLFLGSKMIHNNKFIVSCCFGDKKTIQNDKFII